MAMAASRMAARKIQCQDCNDLRFRPVRGWWGMGIHDRVPFGSLYLEPILIIQQL